MCRGEESGPTGKRTFLNIKTYDEKAKAYTEYGISSLGGSEYQTGGSIVGNKRTFVFNIDVEGKPTKLRYTELEVLPTLFTVPSRGVDRRRAMDGNRRGQGYESQIAALRALLGGAECHRRLTN